MIASHGHTPDIRRLAGALCQASSIYCEGGRQDLGAYLKAESVSVHEQLAECGDDFVALSSHVLIQNEPVELFDHVRALRRNATQHEDTA